MKTYNALYYLLTVLLITGGFASMAQNSYGLTLIGAVSIAFGLLFLIQFLSALSKRGSWVNSGALELLSLSILSFLFALRVWYIRFPYIEWVFVSTAVLLGLFYFARLGKYVQSLKTKSTAMASLIAIYYAAILLFLVAMITVTFLPKLGTLAGALAILLVAVFLASGLLAKDITLDGKNVSAFSFVGRLRDRSILVASLFILFTLYLATARSSILPKIYSDEYPKAYFDLVNKAEMGKTLPVDGHYEFEQFKRQYDKFVIRNVALDAR
jgi:hypothetical protein